MSNFWIVRHGEHNIYMYDGPLTALGQEQSKAAAKVIAEKRPEKCIVIGCSRDLRVIETVGLVAEELEANEIDSSVEICSINRAVEIPTIVEKASEEGFDIVIVGNRRQDFFRQIALTFFPDKNELVFPNVGEVICCPLRNGVSVIQRMKIPYDTDLKFVPGRKETFKSRYQFK